MYIIEINGISLQVCSSKNHVEHMSQRFLKIFLKVMQSFLDVSEDC